jgi:phosphomannomutase
MGCFKAYDIRGVFPQEINGDIAYKVGRAYAICFSPKTVAVGYDARLTSPELKDNLIAGLTSWGVNVFDIGMCGTEQVYFTTFYKQLDGGLMVTASHNPIEYNGIKMVGKDARPIGSHNGLKDIENLVYGNAVSFLNMLKPTGSVSQIDTIDDYIDYLLKHFVDPSYMRPLKVLCNAGNGTAGLVLNKLEKKLPMIEMIKIFNEPDGTFPNGVPNPLLEANRGITSGYVKKEDVDFGVAWDGDFDRCFFFDSKGRFVESYYVISRLIKHIAQQWWPYPIRVVHDTRSFFNTADTIKQMGGVALSSRSGHSFIKDTMRQYKGTFGGEISGHYYFSYFACCDSGIIPFLMMLNILSQHRQNSNYAKFEDLFVQDKQKYFISGEINMTVKDSNRIISELYNHYNNLSKNSRGTYYSDHIDGLRIEHEDDDIRWAFNARASNTEPLLRLCVESNKSNKILESKIKEIVSLINKFDLSL